MEGFFDDYAGSRNQNFRARLHPVSGWALDDAALLDGQRHGFLVGLSQSKAVHRQAVFFAFALKVHEGPAVFLRHTCGPAPNEGTQALRLLADTLLGRSAAIIVDALTGIVPDGFLGALDRIGHDPLRPDNYMRLYRLFSNRNLRRRRDALLAKPNIDDSCIHVAETLHEALLHANVCARVGNAQEVERLNTALEVVQDFVSTATTSALWKSASDLGDNTPIPTWLGRWLTRADRFPDPPFAVDPAILVPLTSAKEMAEAGRRMQNCLATKVINVLAGRHYYYRYLPTEGAIAALTRMNDGSWLLGCVHAHGNDTLPRGFYEAIRSGFEGHNVKCLLPRAVEPRFGIANEVLNRFWSDDLEDWTLEEIGQFA